MDGKKSKKKRPRLDDLFDNLDQLEETVKAEENANGIVKALQQIDAAVIQSSSFTEELIIFKYGLQKVMQFKEAISSVPDILSDSLRLRLCAEYCSLNSSECQEIFRLYDSVGLRSQLNSTGKSLSELSVLAPPTGTCFQCTNRLELCNHVTEVTLICAKTPSTQTKKKVSLRCKRCSLIYNFDKYGDSMTGFRFYDTQREAVEASDVNYVDRQVFNLQWSFAQHAWVSFEGFATAWNDAHGLSPSEGIDRRTLANAFWWGELEQELRELGWVDYRFHSNDDRENCMKKIDLERQRKLYPHADNECNTECKARGCGRLWVTDGIWKLQFPHCMFRVQNKLANMPLLNYPDVCTNQPKQGMAFCTEHCTIMKKKKIPTELRKFLHFAGVLKENSSTEDENIDSHELTAEGNKKIEETLSKIDHVSNVGTSVIDSQGEHEFLKLQKSAIPQVVRECEASAATTDCNKDTGTKQTLRKLSRGHQFVVRSGGHIDSWTPLYQSESQGQVFIILLSWLYLTIKSLPKSAWNKIWLAYDNMCNLLKLKATQTKLPLSEKYSDMWLCINKIIDGLHLKNHKNKDCKEKLHPDKILTMHLDLKLTKNTMAAEQTFVWLSRFKKILCCMPKPHHLFYLHRLVKRRNRYTSLCYQYGKKPLLPKLRNEKTK